MQTLSFLISTLIEIYMLVLLLRIWMQWARCDFYNPFSQFVVKATQPVVAPLRRVIPSFGPIDTSSLLIAVILALLKATLIMGIINGSMVNFSIFYGLLPYIAMFGLFILLKNVGMIIFWVLIIMAIMSWISRGRNPLEYVLIQLAEPILNPIRRFLPGMGGIDFSPMVLILLLYVINMGMSEFLSSYRETNPLLILLWVRA